MAIEKRTTKDGKNRYRANIYIRKGVPRATGEWRTHKKQAEQDETAIKHELFSGTYVDETDKTVDQAMQVYSELMLPKQVTKNTLNRYMSLYNVHIKPKFGTRPLTSLKPYEIQLFYHSKEGEIANSTIIKIHTILNKLYKQFIKWNELKTNPLDHVDKPSPNYKKGETWNREEVQIFLKFAKEYQAYIAFFLALNFGLRLGEILGLQWKHVDFEKNKIYVRDQYDYNQKKITPLKTKSSVRNLDMSDAQAEVLLWWKQKHQHLNSDFVCISETGTHYMPRNIRRAKAAICKHTGIKNIRFHDLRHTHASLLIELGEQPKIVQGRLGHADIKTTLNVYVHTQTSEHKKTADRFSDFINQ